MKYMLLRLSVLAVALCFFVGCSSDNGMGPSEEPAAIRSTQISSTTKPGDQSTAKQTSTDHDKDNGCGAGSADK